jgi:hypothetical protein
MTSVSYEKIKMPWLKNDNFSREEQKGHPVAMNRKICSMLQCLCLLFYLFCGFYIKNIDLIFFNDFNFLLLKIKKQYLKSIIVTSPKPWYRRKRKISLTKS